MKGFSDCSGEFRAMDDGKHLHDGFYNVGSNLFGSETPVAVMLSL
ncbi:MAG: hypothetical protein SPI01_04710 [Succiniclasticum sp.]|nr:hypothetical protein [Succiniclasticum sp.]